MNRNHKIRTCSASVPVLKPLLQSKEILSNKYIIELLLCIREDFVIIYLVISQREMFYLYAYMSSNTQCSLCVPQRIYVIITWWEHHMAMRLYAAVQNIHCLKVAAKLQSLYDPSVCTSVYKFKLRKYLGYEDYWRIFEKVLVKKIQAGIDNREFSI